MSAVSLTNDGPNAVLTVDGLDISDKVEAGMVTITQDSTTRQFIVTVRYIADSLTVDLDNATVYEQ